MSEARVNNLSNESNTGGPTISGISTFSGTNFFVPPVGTTAQRPDNPQKGAIRFNTDTKHLEYYKGDTLGWTEIEASHDQLNGGYRGLFAGGNTPGLSDVVDYITISTFGDAIDFGNLTAGKQRMGVTSDSTRLVTGAGYTTTFEIEMDYFTMSSLGDYADFGDLTTARNRLTAFADSTRGVWAGGNPSTNVMDYVTIQSTGTAKDFGDLTVAGRQSVGGASSSTRGLIFGGLSGSDPYTYHNIIDFVTIATTGNAQDFGDLTTATLMAGSACANSTRALYCGGYSTPGNPINNIEYVTIATKGNSIDFGNGTLARKDGASLADKTRGITAGGSNPTLQSRIDCMEIATLGDALDFGDLSVTRTSVSGSSNGHGGL